MASRYHVLVVEDEPLVLDTVQATLEETCHVSSARTVREAQAILRTSHIDVVLIDNVLPDGRGADVAIVAEEVGTAVIEMTGYSQDSASLDAHGRPHLFKPFQIDALLSTIGQALRGQQRSEPAR